MKIIILAGGSGTRLFPLSRECYPKQFLHIAGNLSLLQQTVNRFRNIVRDEDIVILTNESYIFLVQNELRAIYAEKIHVACEPVGRNTAPAIALAIAYCRESLGCKDDEVLFVTPSDHLISPQKLFENLVLKCESVAKDGRLVILGVNPSKPETGYGYIHSGDAEGEFFKVQEFKEKPNKETAEKYLQEGSYYWNAGMYIFNIQCMVREFERFSPEISELLSLGYKSIMNSYNDMPDISIDYAVAEKADDIVVAPMGDLYWNDIGSFDSISEVLKDKENNVYNGDITTEDCQNTMIIGGNRLICGIGLNDLLVVDTPDVLLVAQKGQSQKVRDIVNRLKHENRKEVHENVTMFRPWGSYTVLVEGQGYKVKKIEIKPGGKLSLQLHYHRSEHWTVISGTGKCTLGDKEMIFRENESTFIPIGVKHRLENPGKIPLVIIEVQNGKYLGEDDIVRFDDIYGRVH